MKPLIIFLFVCVISVCSFAQKLRFDGSVEIISQIPEIKIAQAKLNKLCSYWSMEIEAIYAQITKLNGAFEEEKNFLTDELKKKRQDEIENLTREAKKLQTEKFGVDGELFKKRDELMATPILQRKIHRAIYYRLYLPH